MSNYWTRKSKGAWTRRKFIQASGAATLGAATLGVVGCGDDDDNGDTGGAPTRTPQATATPVAETPTGGKVTMSVSQPDLLDPHRLFQVPVRNVVYAIYDGLVGFDEQLNVVPGLATDWEVVDESDFILTLREGVKFHDGTDFNAESVVTNFTRLLDPATKAPDAAVFPGLKVTAVDAKTVRFTNPTPNADFLLNLTEKPGQMISPKALTDLGNDVGVKPVGSGPFEFVEWVQGDHITLRKFPGYWDKGYPFLDELEFRDIQDGSVVSAGLRSGDLDIGSPAPADFDSIAKNDAFQVWSGPGIGNVSDIILFPKNEPFGDPRTREALVWAIDREAINRVVYADLHLVPHGVIPPSFWAYDPEIETKGWGYDVKKAKELLTGAGFPNGFEFTNWVANNPTSIRLAETIQAMLQQAGISMKIEAIDGNARIDKQRTGDIQATIAGFSGRVALDQFFTINYHTAGGFNYAKYSVPARDTLIEKARITFDIAERTSLYRELEQLIIKDPGPRTPLIFQQNQYIVRKGVGQDQPAYLPDNMIRFKHVYRES